MSTLQPVQLLDGRATLQTHRADAEASRADAEAKLAASEKARADLLAAEIARLKATLEK